MKKISTLLIAIMAFMFINATQAQVVVFSSGFETWNGNVPANWIGAKTTLEADSISPYTTSVHGGTSAVKLVNAESAHKRFTTQAMALDSTTVYTITFWVRGQGNIRTGLFDGRPTGSGYATYNPYINVNSTTWTQQSQSITCTNTTMVGEFILSVQYTVAASDHLQVDDVTITRPGIAVPSIVITSPANNATVYAAATSVVFNVSTFVVGNPGTGIDGHIHYKLDGGASVMQYNTNPVALTGLTPGNHQFIMQLVDNSHNPLTPNVADTLNFIVDLNPPNLQTIYDIQYTQDITGNSPFMGQVVSAYGVVTGKHAAGYFMQQGSGAWNGIFVYDNVNQPTLGDSILVTGTVAEYYNFTEFTTITNFSLLASGIAQPAPVSVTCAQVNTEDFEGVLVKATHVTCVNPNVGFGMWKIQDASDTAKVHNLLFSFTPVLNTIYNVTGPVYYYFGEFRIEPRSAADVVVSTGIGNIDPATQVSLYPNPVVETLTLTGVTLMQKAVITSLSGQAILTVDLNKQAQTQLDVRSLPAGYYTLSLYHQDGSRVVKSFVKE